MRKFSLFAIAFGLLCYAVGTTAPDESEKHAKQFLSEANKILRQDPDDGKFGITRLPSMHGRSYFDGRKPEEKAVSDAWQELAKTNYLAVVAYGNFDKDGAPKRRTTMSGHYQLNYAPFVKNDSYFTAERSFHEQVGPSEAASLYRSGKSESRKEMDYAGNAAVINYRSIFPSSKNCMSCHDGALKGKPIGILAIIRVPKQE